MYPRLSDLINDLLGTNILLPAKTFGFFLALSFVAAFLVLKRELARKERLGHFVLRKENELVEGPLPFTQVILHALVWGLVGYKLGYMFVDAAAFSKDTEGVLLSAKGFWLTGLLAAAGGGGYHLARCSSAAGPRLPVPWTVGKGGRPSWRCAS